MLQFVHFDLANLLSLTPLTKMLLTIAAALCTIYACDKEALNGKEIVDILLLDKNTKNYKKLERMWLETRFWTGLYQERGGWIFADKNNPNKLRVITAPRSASKTFKLDANTTTPFIDLEDVGSAKKGWILLANFHTHPLRENQKPSKPDICNAFRRGLPGIVIAREKIWTYGPEKREDFATTERPGAYPYPMTYDINNYEVKKSAVSNPFPRIP